MSKVLTKQKEFVKWLKENYLYNQFDSAHTMLKMEAVWIAMKREIKGEDNE